LTKLTSKIKVIPPPDVKPADLQAILGRFHKQGVDLPFSGEEVDPRLLDDYITPVAQEMIKSLQRTEKHFILLGKSGDGKTRAIFDVAREFFTIYIECVPEEDERKDITKDQLYGQFARDVELLIKNVSNEEDRFDIVEKRFLIELASRLLYLRLLTKHFPNVTSQQFLVSQLNGGKTMTEGIRFFLQKHEPKREFLNELIYWFETYLISFN
jgi:hypothetical protein